MFFCDQNANEPAVASFCWVVSNNYSETVKYDEKQQTKNRPSNQVYFLFTILLYLAAYRACLN